LLGTFWLIVGVAGVIAGISGEQRTGLLIGPLLVAYAIFLYRGGRFGLIIW
jgi:hypothetical protein